MFLQQLSILKNEDLRSATPARLVHVIAEGAKLALADRLAWYGDPNHVDVPLGELLSDAYGAARYRLIEHSASRELRPGCPAGRLPNLPDLSVSDKTLKDSETRFGIGEPTFVDLPPVREWAQREVFVGDTCHLSVIDAEGNMVAATPSGGWLSSSPVIPALGFSLNTRLQMTWLDAGPSRLVARKRPLTTLSPGMAFKNGQPYMVFGTPGGDQQDQWTVAFFIRHALLGMNLQEAIDAPSWHVDHSPASFWPRAVKLNNITVEQRMDQQVVSEKSAHCRPILPCEIVSSHLRIEVRRNFRARHVSLGSFRHFSFQTMNSERRLDLDRHSQRQARDTDCYSCVLPVLPEDRCEYFGRGVYDLGRVRVARARDDEAADPVYPRDPIQVSTASLLHPGEDIDRAPPRGLLGLLNRYRFRHRPDRHGTAIEQWKLPRDNQGVFVKHIWSKRSLRNLQLRQNDTQFSQLLCCRHSTLSLYRPTA